MALFSGKCVHWTTDLRTAQLYIGKYILIDKVTSNSLLLEDNICKNCNSKAPLTLLSKGFITINSGGGGINTAL